MRDNSSRAAATRSHWLETLDRYMQDRDVPGSADYWSPRLDTASRDEITAIQDAKVAAVVPFLYENSGFYRRRFERLGLIADDIKCAADLIAKMAGGGKSRNGQGRCRASALRHLHHYR
jgi:phenylacetate-CoA ligase